MSLIESALSPVLRELEQRCREAAGFTPTNGLIRLLMHQRRDGMQLALDEADAAAARARVHESPVLSTFGYLAAVDGVGVRLPPEDWSRGRARLAGRYPFPEDRLSFYFRPWELYGVALGVQAHRDTDPSGPGWLAGVLSQGAERTRDGSLEHRLVFNLASRLCGAGVTLPVNEEAEAVPVQDLAMLLWAREQLGQEVCLVRSPQAPEVVLLDRIIQEGATPRDAVAATFLLVAIRDVLRRWRASLSELLLEAGRDSRSTEPARSGTNIFNIAAQSVQVNQDSEGRQTN